MNTNRESITNPQNFIPGLTKAYLPHSNKFGYLSGENIEKFNRFIEKKSFHENNEKNPGDTLLEAGLLSVSLAPDIYEGLSKKVINKTLRKRDINFFPLLLLSSNFKILGKYFFLE